MQSEKIRIRTAGADEDLTAYRSWLPQAFLSSPPPVFFLAEQEEGGELVGLGSLRLLGTNEETTGRFQLYVIPESRRQGIGNRLMQSMIDHTKSGVSKKMLAGVPVSEGSENSKFFESLDGFEVVRTLKQYEFKVQNAWDYIEPLANRLLEKGKLKEGYEITTLEKSNRRRIHQLVMKNLGGIPESLVSRLRGGKGGYLPKLSVVIRNAEGPLAVLLIRRNEKGLVVDTRVVSPEVRGTWANVALMYSFLVKIRKMGVTKAYFEGDDHLHIDTIKLAKRFEAELLDNHQLYGCSFEEKDSEASKTAKK